MSYGMMYAKENECVAAGLDPKEVERIARRLALAMTAARNLGIHIFGGGCGLNMRFDDRGAARATAGSLIVADNLGSNCDGGDGAANEDANGLLRGECATIPVE